MKDPTAIGNYPHFYSTSYSPLHPYREEGVPPSLPVPLWPLLFPILLPSLPPSQGSVFFGNPLPTILRTRYRSRAVPATYQCSLFKPVKSHVTHCRLPGRARTPTGNPAAPQVAPCGSRPPAPVPLSSGDISLELTHMTGRP